jgi:hypothetical protein
MASITTEPDGSVNAMAPPVMKSALPNHACGAGP